MGYTTFTKQLVQKVLDNNKIESVIDLGSQNDYDIGGLKPPFISEWYKSNGMRTYVCIDLAGDNGAIVADLSKPVVPQMDYCLQYDLVTDIGFSEHIVQAKNHMPVSFHGGYINSMYPIGEMNIELGYYNCWLNKFNLCKEGGFIISENPKCGHWPEHGYSYVNFNTYWQLSRVSGLYIVEIGEHPASGNSVDGFEIWCIMKKIDNSFPTFEKWKESVQVYSK